MTLAGDGTTATAADSILIFFLICIPPVGLMDPGPVIPVLTENTEEEELPPNPTVVTPPLLSEEEEEEDEEEDEEDDDAALLSASRHCGVRDIERKYV